MEYVECKYDIPNATLGACEKAEGKGIVVEALSKPFAVVTGVKASG